eukprot:3875023-Amphidinium_carterae.1
MMAEVMKSLGLTTTTCKLRGFRATWMWITGRNIKAFLTTCGKLWILVEHWSGILTSWPLRQCSLRQVVVLWCESWLGTSCEEELREIISYLRDPGTFYALGALPPRGVLLMGPSGASHTS